MYNNRHFVGHIQQEAIANHLAFPSCDLYIVTHGEEIWIHAFDKQTSWVIVEVSLPVGKLPFVQQDLVVVASFEKHWAMVFWKSRRNGSLSIAFRSLHCAIRSLGCAFSSLHCASSSLGVSFRSLGFSPRIRHQFPPRPAAPCFEATHHVAQGFTWWHIVLHPYYHVDMVGHDAYSPYFYHRIEPRDFLHFLLKDDFPKS